jgi:hypothetical protein
VGPGPGTESFGEKKNLLPLQGFAYQTHSEQQVHCACKCRLQRANRQEVVQAVTDTRTNKQEQSILSHIIGTEHYASEERSPPVAGFLVFAVETFCETHVTMDVRLTTHTHPVTSLRAWSVPSLLHMHPWRSPYYYCYITSIICYHLRAGYLQLYTLNKPRL